MACQTSSRTSASIFRRKFQGQASSRGTLGRVRPAGGNLARAGAWLAGLLTACAWLVPGAARAELGSLGTTTIGLALSGGIQPDSRSCDVGGSSRSVLVPDGGRACVLWAGGIEGSILWRGHIGVALGLYSVAGQAAVPQMQPGSEQAPPAFPDRISVPLLLDTRPFSILGAAAGTGYLARFLHGIRFGLGPSFELVRTSADSSIAWGQRIGEPARTSLGAHFTLDIEVPLHAAAASALSLRFSGRLLYVPLIPLNNGDVRSANFDADPPAGTTFLGYGTHGQLFLGFVYYL